MSVYILSNVTPNIFSIVTSKGVPSINIDTLLSSRARPNGRILQLLARFFLNFMLKNEEGASLPELANVSEKERVHELLVNCMGNVINTRVSLSWHHARRP